MKILFVITILKGNNILTKIDKVILKHLPYYRQSEIYQRDENIELSRSTMASWGGQCSRLLDIIVDKIKEEKRQILAQQKRCLVVTFCF